MSKKHWRVRQGYVDTDTLLMAIAPLIQSRLKRLNDVVELAGFFFDLEFKPASKEVWLKWIKEAKISEELTVVELKLLQLWLSSEPDRLKSFDLEAIEAKLTDFEEQTGLEKKYLYGLLRLAVIGREVSPPLIQTMLIFGQEEVLDRLAITWKQLTGE